MAQIAGALEAAHLAYRDDRLQDELEHRRLVANADEVQRVQQLLEVFRSEVVNQGGTMMIDVIKCLYSARTECVTSVCTVLNRCWCRRGAPFELKRG